MNIITLDFETLYGTNYTLSTMTTEEYIRDPRFEVIGVSVKVNDEAAVWFSGTKKKTSEWLDQFEMDKHLCIAHNAVFDMAILNWHFDIRPKRIVDTLSMARAIVGSMTGVGLAKLVQHFGLGEKGTEVVQAFNMERRDFTPDHLAAYGRYCCNDTELTRKLFDVLAVGFPLMELKLIDLTIRMFTEPVLELDHERLEEHLTNVLARKKTLMDSMSLEIEDLMSNPKLASVLGSLGVTPPMKVSPTTQKQTYAFAKNDEEFTDLLNHPDPTVQAIVAARLGVKSTLEETRTERFISISGRGSLPVPLRYYAAHTGRWGGDDKINLQNLQRSSPLKSAMMAPEGFMMVDSDSSQIEARTLAWLAQQDDLVDAFDRKEDVYRIMASSIYGKDPKDITKDERFVGKTTILGAGYGMGPTKFKLALKNATPSVDITLDEAERIISTYRETYSRIPELWNEGKKALEAILGGRTTDLGRPGALVVNMMGIRLPNSLYVRYPGLRWVELEEGDRPQFVYDTLKGRTVVPNRIYGGKVIENVCQALARIVIGEQMLLVAQRYRPVMTVHDAIAIIAPEVEIEEAQAYVEQCMNTRPKWAPDLPLACEAGNGFSYGEC
jgi:DNA polymerase I-like protein with 3'-5' exonuclease and polymerase domains